MARRFRIYFFGVILGLIFVYVSLIKDRGKELLAWLPGARVLGELAEAPKSISNKANCQLKCLLLGESFIDEMFQNGDVDFSRSRPKEIPRFYVVEVESDEKQYEFDLSFKDSLTTIVQVIEIGSSTKCNCN